MIRFVDQDPFPDGPDDLFYARIRCLWETYGRLPGLADFWVQESDDGVTAWLCRMDGGVTLSLLPQADQEELDEFVWFLAPASLFCAPEYHIAGWNGTKRGTVLQYSGSDTCLDTAKLDLVTNPPGERVYSLLSQCRNDAVELPARDGFLSDYARRIRLGTGRAKLLRCQGEDAAVAMTTAESPRLSVVGGVATLPAFRGRGAASLLLDRLTRELLGEHRRVLLAAGGKDRATFYQKRGFDPCGGWTLCWNDPANFDESGRR